MNDITQKKRSDILAEIKGSKARIEADTKDEKSLIKYVELLYQAGEFSQARDIIAQEVMSDIASNEALTLTSRLEYLLGNYEAAEELYARLLLTNTSDPGAKIQAKVGLLMCYYQTNQFAKAKDLEFPAEIQLPHYSQMKGFDETPYQLEWHNPDKISTVPFLVTDPLPLLNAEINGVPVIMLFDTGGDQFILDTEIANGMGIKNVGAAAGSFGGGKQAEVGFAKVDQVKIGDVTMKHVPVSILPTKRFSPGFEDGKYIIGGIIGTAAMRQFLGTLDYENGQLVLKERNEANARKLRKDLEGRIAAEVPFVMTGTHQMMVRGSLNSTEGLTFFVDSGLDSEACFTAPVQTLNYVGIPVPETKIDEKAVGGGGGKYATGLFPIETISMGKLNQSNVLGEYGSMQPETYWQPGFIQDGLISHQFFRQYKSWTLDFDQMTYIFEK